MDKITTYKICSIIARICAAISGILGVIFILLVSSETDVFREITGWATLCSMVGYMTSMLIMQAERLSSNIDLINKKLES